MSKLSHGGSRPPVRKDDGRLARKMVEPVRETLVLEKEHRDELKKRYGREWLDVIRQLIEDHITPAQQRN